MRRYAGEFPPRERDAAGVERFEACDGAQEGALAAAARAEQRDGLARLHAEIHAVEHAAAAEDDRRALHDQPLRGGHQNSVNEPTRSRSSPTTTRPVKTMSTCSAPGPDRS